MISSQKIIARVAACVVAAAAFTGLAHSQTTTATTVIPTPASSADSGARAVVAITVPTPQDIRGFAADVTQGGYDRAWTTQFPNQTRNGMSSSWARINTDGSVDASYGSWLGFSGRIYNPSLGDGAKPIVKASCAVGSSSRGADRITSNHYMALIPEGNPGTGLVTGWTMRVGYDAWAVTSCSGRWRVYDYRSNGSVVGPFDI